MQIKNKILWITGASSGIGEAIAIEAAKIGAKLIISSRNADKLKKLEIKCLQYTKDCMVLPLDLEKLDNADDLIAKILQKYSGIDILINNGGISQRSLITETPIKNYRKLMEINFFGSIILTKSVLPLMKAQNYGHIAVTSSITGKFGFPLRSGYAASKHALHGFFETLAFEVAQYNINVTIVCPGRIYTKISENALTKDGLNYGKMDQGQAFGMSSQQCAKKYLSAIKKNRKEVYIGRKEIFMVYLKRYIPSVFRKIASKVTPT